MGTDQLECGVRPKEGGTSLSVLAYLPSAKRVRLAEHHDNPEEAELINCDGILLDFHSQPILP